MFLPSLLYCKDDFTELQGEVSLKINHSYSAREINGDYLILDNLYSVENIVRDSFLSGNSQVRKRNRRLLESWPTAVEILMTLVRYRVRSNNPIYNVYSILNIVNYQYRTIVEENLYTSGIYDMIDTVNQRTVYGSGYHMDMVNGYTIKELENALSGARYWNDYRDKVKAMYPNKPTRPYVDELFANWQD